MREALLGWVEIQVAPKQCADTPRRVIDPCTGERRSCTPWISVDSSRANQLCSRAPTSSAMSASSCPRSRLAGYYNLGEAFPMQRKRTRANMKEQSTVQDCLQEIIARGSGYVVSSSTHIGAQRTVEWEPSALLADMRRESPNVLLDHAWTEWSRLADGSQSCAIVYGKVGASPGERGVPGYGLLHVYESWHQQRITRSKDILASTGFRLGSGDRLG
jgi:hypothetical protein